MPRPKLTIVPTPGCIEIRGARQNNLKGIDLDLPLGKLNVISYVRKNNIPYFGICYGMQLAVLEYAQNVLKLNVTYVSAWSYADSIGPLKA